MTPARPIWTCLLMTALLATAIASTADAKPDPCRRDPSADGCGGDTGDPSDGSDMPSRPEYGPVYCHGLDICRVNGDWIRYAREVAEYLLP